jgi:hypothetical protein
MLLWSAFAQWDATAHHLSHPFDMSDWMSTLGVSGIGGALDIHQCSIGFFVTL